MYPCAGPTDPFMNNFSAMPFDNNNFYTDIETRDRPIIVPVIPKNKEGINKK